MYKEVARHLISQMKSHFGLERVEQKQTIPRASGAEGETALNGPRMDVPKVLLWMIPDETRSPRAKPMT